MMFRLHLDVVDECGQREIYEFGGQCNYVDYVNDKFCKFMHKDDTKNTIDVLMLVPYNNILFIEQVEED